MDMASQVFAALARARQARELLELVGEAGLSVIDRRHLEFDAVFQPSWS
jgi:V/A-type H+/Na+-transporting ATPase subunit B